MKKISTLRKSPLHPSALGLNDLFVGRKITLYNVELGQMGDYIVLRKPYIGMFGGVLTHEGKSEKSHLILLRPLDVSTDSPESSSQPKEMFVADMGITPRSISNSKPNWGVNVTVDSRKKDLLPKARHSQPRRRQARTVEIPWPKGAQPSGQVLSLLFP